MGQQAPGAATPQDIEAGIDEHPLLAAQRRSDPWWWQQGSELGPLALGQIRRIAFSRHGGTLSHCRWCEENTLTPATVSYRL